MELYHLHIFFFFLIINVMWPYELCFKIYLKYLIEGRVLGKRLQRCSYIKRVLPFSSVIVEVVSGGSLQSGYIPPVTRRITHSFLGLQGWLNGCSEELTGKRIVACFTPILSLLLLVFCALVGKSIVLFFSLKYYKHLEKKNIFLVCHTQ